MANTPSKDEKTGKFASAKDTGTTKGESVNTSDTTKSDNALAKLTSTKSIAPSKIGRSPQELRAGEYPYDEKAFDPEQQPVAPEAQGAVGYADSSQAAFNEPYIDGGGLYSKPVRKD